MVDAFPTLRIVAKALKKARLQAIMIGNAAAALQGAPLTTVDFDFLIRETGLTKEKIKKFAIELGGTVYRPFYPVLKLYRVSNDDTGIQVDLMTQIHGIKSFASLKSRAETIDIEGYSLLVSSIGDIIKSKEEAGRERDLATLPVLKKLNNELLKKSKRKAKKA